MSNDQVNGMVLWDHTRLIPKPGSIFPLHAVQYCKHEQSTNQISTSKSLRMRASVIPNSSSTIPGNDGNSCKYIYYIYLEMLNMSTVSLYSGQGKYLWKLEQDI